ncbi:MAG: 4-hydroxyphenylacetate 3-monooxygenase, oxygenase component [Gammaproteobacteria bacterium]|nr:4-hydroxyphenylacetate 3-monooxygenase, oxygenase component [Pseudomonadota bacterium]MCH9662074.1 4-hydroxyphenylacetate 3-monooxygenase, oxygenase component [Gammaproteobacteria bacterium]
MARTGQQFLDRVRAQPAEIWHRGKRVADPVSEPGFAGGLRSYAELYDARLADESTNCYRDEKNRLINYSFMIPKTIEDLQKIGKAMQFSADFGMGMLGRDPSYINRAIAAYAAAAPLLDDKLSGAGEAVRNYLDHISAEDLSSTHTLINPQVNRSKSMAEQKDPGIAAHVVKETDSGIYISGARLLVTLPVAEEVMVFPSTVLRNPEQDAPYAFAFCIPSATEGLRFICRETLDVGGSHYDHPFSSRFEEMDAVIIFDNVFVPWEKIFIYKDVEMCNRAYAESGATAHMAHQVICKNIAKTETVLGTISLIIDAIGLAPFQHIHEKVAQVWCNLQTMKAFKRVAEVDAAPNAFGMMTPNWDALDAARNIFPKMYPQMIEIVQQTCASGLVSMPTRADVDGPLGETIDRYYQAGNMDARARIPLFRLAYDLALSGFASRQVLYERFFFGDPVRMYTALFNNKDRKPYMDKVRHFLDKGINE